MSLRSGSRSHLKSAGSHRPDIARAESTKSFAASGMRMVGTAVPGSRKPQEPKIEAKNSKHAAVVTLEDFQRIRETCGLVL